MINIITSVATGLNWLIYVYSFVLVIYALLSWAPNLYHTAIGRLIVRISEPYVSLFRRLPLRIAMLDLSVFVAVVALQFIQQFIVIVANWLLQHL